MDSPTVEPKGKFDLDLGMLFYRDMVRMRRLEQASAKVYQQGKIAGFCHLYIGQEAVAAGCIHALRPEDHVITAYRDHGQALAKGMSARSIMAEMYGRETGCVKGLGGSMHLFDKDKRFYGGHGIVGAHVPLAAGIAFASKYEDRKEVTLCFLGDGATNQGAFFEGLQLSSLWGLPVVFVIENNFYAMGTSLARQTSEVALERRGDAFGMHTDVFWDHDVFGVHERMSAAYDRARNENKPTLVNLMTYRHRGHSMSDPAKYRTKDELNEHKQTDPLKILEQRLLNEGGVSPEALKAIEDEAKAEVADSLEFAENSPWPDASVAWDYVEIAEGGEA